MISGSDFKPFQPVLVGGREEKRNEDRDGIMTHVKACEEKTPARSSSIFAGFSNPQASTNRNSEGHSVQLRPGAQNENNPQQRDWERGVWDLVFHSYYGNLTRDNVCG